jgi:large subunit ribosomal protein L29
VKIKEIREHSDDQLKTEMEALERRLFELRSQAVTEKVQASSELNKARKDIARILTVMHERRQGVEAAATGGGKDGGR